MLRADEITAWENAIAAWATQTVTFRDPATGLKIQNTKVNIYAAWDVAKLDPDAENYDWVIEYPQSLTYSDGKHPRANHKVQWADFSSTNHEQTLENPKLLVNPVPFYRAYVRERSASGM